MSGFILPSLLKIEFSAIILIRKYWNL